jgi:hypothetical protein
MGQVIGKLSPGALLHASPGAVLAEIAERTGCGASSRRRVSEGHVRAVVDALASNVISIQVRAIGADWQADVAGVVGIGVWLRWTGSNASPS